MTQNLVKFASFMKTQKNFSQFSWFLLRLPADCWFVPVDGVHVHMQAALLIACICIHWLGRWFRMGTLQTEKKASIHVCTHAYDLRPTL